MGEEPLFETTGRIGMGQSVWGWDRGRVDKEFYLGQAEWRQWQPTPVFLPGDSQGQRAGGLQPTGWQRVRHNWARVYTHGKNREWRVRGMLIVQASGQKYNRTASISTKEVDKCHYHVDQCFIRRISTMTEMFYYLPCPRWQPVATCGYGELKMWPVQLRN